MDIGATWYNRRKGKKGKCKGKGKHNKGKGYGGYGNNYHYNNYKGEGKQHNQPVGQRNPFKGPQGFRKEKGYSNKGKGKGKGYYKYEKEQKENMQDMLATDVDSQDTWPNNAEWRFTTLTPTVRQMTGTAAQPSAL